MTVADFDADLPRNPANFQPLTPLSFLERAAETFPDHVAVIHGHARLPYRDLLARSRRLASALAGRGIGRGDVVSVMLANTPPMLECHYGVPMSGAVLNTLNTRLDAPSLAAMLDHAGTKLLITDRAYADIVAAALAAASARPIVVDYDDPEFPQTGARLGELDYEAWLATGSPDFSRTQPQDEWDAISLNYTSGTTGGPKGVVYHHRGAYLLALGNVLTGAMGPHPVYLWTLPMFHCNGWCFPWTLSVVAGTHVCLRAVRTEAMWQAIGEHGVTHLCGAPIVMSTLLAAPPETRPVPAQPVRFMTAAAPPPQPVLAAMQQAGFLVTHLYGLTETYGPAVVNEWHADWEDLAPAEWAARKARQGVRYVPLEALEVMDPQTMQPMPADGETVGEVMFRGNVVMKGYLRDPEATAAAFAGGWFHSGDLGVKHADGYIELKDRSKDIIISGGENVSSIEVEAALHKHPAVANAAVVAMPHDKWGETPCGFVELRAGHTADEAELVAWCREHLAGYKRPGKIVFMELPRTSTGKVQKFALRSVARSLAGGG
jgi:fatty-acyl-CoA synthase